MKNKNLLLTAIAIFGFVILTMGQIPNYVPTNGLVGYWPFNGNANDESGNGLNCTVNGPVLSTDRFGFSNKAYNFDGINDDMVLGSNLFNTNEGTFSAWIYIANKNSTDHLPIFSQTESTALNNSLRFSIWTDSLAFVCDYRKCGGSKALPMSRAKKTISMSTWYHIVVTSNGSVNKYYINGTEYGFVSQNNPAGEWFYDQCTGTKTVYLGRWFRTINNDFFNGKLDDIGIWNRALTSNEITELYLSHIMSPAYITPSGSTTFCQGGSVVLNSNLIGSSYSYQWLKDGNVITNANSVTYSAIQSGTYTLKIDSASYSVTSKNSIVVTVNQLPSVSISLAPFINYQTTSVPLTGSPSGGTFSGVGVSGTSLYPATAGLGVKKLTYSYTDGNGCKNSASVSTLVYDTITCLVTHYDTVITKVTHYDTVITKVTHYDTITTKVAVTDTLIINVKLTGVTPPNNHNTIKIYPNPTKDKITIDNGNYATMTVYTIKIINSLSQTVYQSLVNNKTVTIDLNSWTGKGIYVIQIIDGSSKVIEIRKIVLQ